MATAHRAIRTPPVDSGAAGWDVVALALIRWDPSHLAPQKLSDMPLAAFYEAQSVGVVRSIGAQQPTARGPRVQALQRACAVFCMC